MKSFVKCSRHVAIRFLVLSIVGFLAVASWCSSLASDSRQHDVEKIKQLVTSGNWMGLTWLERECWDKSGIDCPHQPLSDPQQAEINQLALGLAKRLSLHSTVDLDEADELGQPRGDFAAVMALRSLTMLRVVNEPQIIPHLIDALDHRYEGVAKLAHETLRLLTRRLWFAGNPSKRVYHEFDEQLKVWWKEWWRQNKDKHPVFDVPLEDRAKSEVKRIALSIENLKPKYSELAMFNLPEDLRYSYTLPMFRIESNPANRSVSVPGLDLKKQAFVEVVCNFESTDPDGKTVGERDGDHRVTYPSNIVDVFYQKLEGTDIFVRVRVGTSNTNLIENLKSTLLQK